MTLPRMTDRDMGTALADLVRKDAQRKSRKKKFGTFLSTIATVLLTDVLTSLLAGWSLMLAVAVIHDHWITTCPTVGYWWAVLIAFLFRSALPSRSGSSKTSGGTR